MIDSGTRLVKAAQARHKTPRGDHLLQARLVLVGVRSPLPIRGSDLDLEVRVRRKFPRRRRLSRAVRGRQGTSLPDMRRGCAPGARREYRPRPMVFGNELHGSLGGGGRRDCPSSRSVRMRPTSSKNGRLRSSTNRRYCLGSQVMTCTIQVRYKLGQAAIGDSQVGRLRTRCLSRTSSESGGGTSEWRTC